ncbi:MAG TPA: PRC-barrel domain-containing protein [Acidimicrobiia bacterium]|nr:PRC-barrel domain-containing protein [Acidimicrobiia bacterium]
MAQETLIRLNDTDLDLTNPSEDVRGEMVVDAEGNELGKVDELLIDETKRRVRFLEVGSGGFLGIGEEKRLIPIDAVTSVDDEVHIDKTRQHVAGAPNYDPDVARTRDTYYGDYYGYYGYAPFWTPGYTYPGYPHR